MDNQSSGHEKNSNATVGIVIGAIAIIALALFAYFYMQNQALPDDGTMPPDGSSSSEVMSSEEAASSSDTNSGVDVDIDVNGGVQ